MHEQTLALVKSLSVGGCSCYQINGMASSGSYDGMTGKYVPGINKPGTTVKCMRCKARAALDADGVEYEKDDRMFFTTLI